MIAHASPVSGTVEQRRFVNACHQAVLGLFPVGDFIPWEEYLIHGALSTAAAAIVTMPVAATETLEDLRARAIDICDRVRPPGGRAWTCEQLACYEALGGAMRAIETVSARSTPGGIGFNRKAAYL